MRRVVLFPIILLLSISLISAIGIGGALDQLGGENLILLSIFLITFVILNLVLGRSRFFKREKELNKKVIGFISLILAMLITYVIHILNIDLQGIFSSLGMSETVLKNIIIWAIIFGLGFTFWKLKSASFAIMGLLLIGIIMFTDLVYEKAIVLFLGISLIAFWVFLKLIRKKF